MMINQDEISIFWLPLAVMIVDWVAVAGRWKRLEYFAKPAAILALLAYLWLNGATTIGSGWALTWFSVGLIGSLAGDILLLLDERFFVAGLVAFLLGHVAYIVGLNLGGVLWPIEALLVIPVALVGGWLFRRVSAALLTSGHGKLRLPVAVYTAVISLMVVSAVTTLFRPTAPLGAAIVLSLGAILFFASDSVLAWNRFVAPLPYGKIIVIVAYHLGQLALIAGAIGLFLFRVVPGL